MRWIQATADVCMEVGHNLRKEDEIEVHLSHGMSGLNAVMESYVHSDIIQAIEGDSGNPVGLTGVVGDQIWLLGTEELTATKHHRWQLCVYGREWVDYCLEMVGAPIGNHVYSKNRLSIRWLKHIGFTVEKPVAYGVAGALFCPFRREP